RRSSQPFSEREAEEERGEPGDDAQRDVAERAHPLAVGDERLRFQLERREGRERAAEADAEEEPPPRIERLLGHQRDHEPEDEAAGDVDDPRRPRKSRVDPARERLADEIARDRSGAPSGCDPREANPAFHARTGYTPARSRRRASGGGSRERHVEVAEAAEVG